MVGTVAALVTGITWKIAILGMAAERQRFERKHFPYVASQKEFARQVERRRACVSVVHYESGHTRIQVKPI